MKIFVIGTRGIPDIPGGVEKHCQELYPRIAAAGHEVILATRKPYVKSQSKGWRGIELLHCHAPRRKSLEAIVHTLLAILKARRRNPDLVHIHAVGPGLLVPFARLLGMKVVVTNHGPDYDRQKWGVVAKIMLRLGEYLGGRFAHERIAISWGIADLIRQRCGRESNLIFNGVALPQPSTTSKFLEKNGIRPGGYLLAVARLVPEKGLHDLVKAFSSLRIDHQLVIAGDADHRSEYSESLKEQASEDDRIVMTGYITGADLNEVYSHARLFVLPSYHEGLPIALLEALSYGLPVLVSDIPANQEVGLPGERYFRVGNVRDLQGKMAALLEQEMDSAEKAWIDRQLTEKYNWEIIARQTLAVYEKTLAGEQ
jgi:glycosyltransferase involved in cell wall biosynthesis